MGLRFVLDLGYPTCINAGLRFTLLHIANLTSLLSSFTLNAFIPAFQKGFRSREPSKHFKSVMILYKANDALMCKVFAMTLRGAAQDWFHILPSGSISSFKELAYVLTKEYTSYRMIKKNLDHLYSLRKSPTNPFETISRDSKQKMPTL
ncbi:hypothetical protein L3X38_037631 [Prunus dulcis]|uniref:Retrotransposon gag domain-containing protein n=1 Tax=Prunus dulcis TaxID=3755 RepID=A0AAD4V3R7_PRUDU|nr:hypothetical protein L3X38_037631 [Prunus dulcis]